MAAAEEVEAPAVAAMVSESEAIRLLAAVYFLEGGISCPYDEYSGGAWQPGMKATETTESASPDETGVYATPVYFDWRACWPLVKALFDQPETQRILHLSVAHSRGEEKWGVPFDPARNRELLAPYDKSLKWPYFHQTKYDRCGVDGDWEQILIARALDGDDATEARLLEKVLPRLYATLVAALEDSDDSSWCGALEHEPAPTRFAAVIEAEGLDVANRTTDELRAVFTHAMESSDLRDRLSDILEYKSDQHEAWESVLEPWLQEHLDTPLLLNGGPAARYCASYSIFLAYKLAWELAPPDADLRIVTAADVQYAAMQYATVHDVRHNVVYDLGWCFTGGVEASEALGHTRGGVDETERWWRYKSDWRAKLLRTKLFHTLRFRVGLPAEILAMIKERTCGVLDVCHVADWDFGAMEEELKRAVMG